MRKKPDFTPNKRCLQCTRSCKQSSKLELLHCPRFDQISEQLEIPLGRTRKPKKK